MAVGRAKKGGEIGNNGEFYKGGAFLPNTTLPKRGSSARHSRAPQQGLVAPGLKADVPEGKRPIFQRIMNFVEVAQDGKLRILRNLDSAASACWDHYGPFEEVRGLVDRYNAGDRYFESPPS